MSAVEYARARAVLIRQGPAGMSAAELADLASRGWNVGGEKPEQKDVRTMNAAEFASAKARAIRGNF